MERDTIESGSTGKHSAKPVGGAFQPVEPHTIIAGKAGESGSANSTGDGSSNPAGYFPDGRPRRRKPRGQGKIQEARAAPPIDFVVTTLTTLHLTLAAIARTPELMIAEEDAKALGNAIVKVCEFEGVGVNPRVMAWTNLAIIATGIYGPRAIAIYVKSQRRGAQSPSANGVADATHTRASTQSARSIIPGT